MKDLLVLTADKNAEFFIKGLLKRFEQSNEIAAFSFDIITHPRKDPGVATQSIEYLRPHIRHYRYLIILFDHEGCGKEGITRDELERSLEGSLNNNGWLERNCCILLCPELESWVWVNKSALHDIISWENTQDVYDWIMRNGFEVKHGSRKPERPKEAFELVLRKCGIARSSALYFKLAQQAKFEKCVDPSFKKLVATIMRWFTKNKST